MTLEEISEGSVVISNANLELEFDEETHLLKSIKGQKVLLGFDWLALMLSSLSEKVGELRSLSVQNKGDLSS